MSRFRLLACACFPIIMLGACATPPQVVKTPEAPPPLGKVVTAYNISGALMYRERMMLPPNAVMKVTLSDVSIMDRAAPVVSQIRRETQGQQVPLTFDLTVDAEKIRPGGRYAVRGVIEAPDGTLMWTTDTVHLINTALESQDLGNLMMVSARTPVHGDTNAGQLVGEAWRVDVINGDAITTDAPVTLTFTADGELFGSTGCNRYSTSYDVIGESLEIQPAAMTRRACMSADVMKTEQDFANVLSAVDSFELTHTGKLVLRTSDGRMLVASR